MCRIAKWGMSINPGSLSPFSLFLGRRENPPSPPPFLPFSLAGKKERKVGA